MIALFRDFRVADAKVCQANWCGLRNGKGFFCAFCGHDFQVGDEYRAIYTNDLPGASGNPLCCRGCFAAHVAEEGLRARWQALCEEHRTRFKWWAIHSDCGEG